MSARLWQAIMHITSSHHHQPRRQLLEFCVIHCSSVFLVRCHLRPRALQAAQLYSCMALLIREPFMHPTSHALASMSTGDLPLISRQRASCGLNTRGRQHFHSRQEDSQSCVSPTSTSTKHDCRGIKKPGPIGECTRPAIVCSSNTSHAPITIQYAQP